MYMFRPIAAIIRLSFESMVVALIGLVWLYHDGEISTSVMFAIVKGHGGRICYAASHNKHRTNCTNLHKHNTQPVNTSDTHTRPHQTTYV